MIEAKNITKTFPGVKALDDVSVKFNSGEIHGLLGENGSGKSTLIKVMCGIYHPNSGSVFLDGKGLHFVDYKDALGRAISMVSQEIQVVPESTIAENIMLAKLNQYKKIGLIDWKRIHADAEKYLQKVGVILPVTMKVMGLSAAHKQLIQIAKALSANAKILFLDEPTSSLTQYEAENLFTILKELKNEGVGIVFVSHKLEEVLEICDKVTVLRDGKLIATKGIEGLTHQEIIRMMIARDTETEEYGRLDYENNDVVLEVKNLCQGSRFKNMSFSLRKGEILGFYGLVGSGRTELVKILIGEDKMDSGEVYINGNKAKIRSVADILNKYKTGYVSENRKEEGLILMDTVRTNISITFLRRIREILYKFINVRKEKEKVHEMIHRLDIKTTGIHQIVNNLSGGNQQKVSISKWLAADCDILIIDEPTVGVDVGAKEYIHNLIWELAATYKKAIILISSEMPEMISLARRILIFRNSEIVAEIHDLNKNFENRYEYTSSQIGQYFV